ncbi:Aspartate aminotransferase [Pirellulimonas nuda]|uniref:Aminotransferase n=1 Tax=Pirellulimonas nuda TaxID=2528009 RepID=A0A518D627_9BACT|nr:amino acid aminotransferase [Pirellulimonas nuda]QDU86924.1 Aspartate aminotransferase [Pirellulimonas nuda]
MFQSVVSAPPDPILGLTDAFKADPRADKINLGVGVYQDEAGRTPVLPAVVEASRRVVERSDTKNYLPIPGDPAYGLAVQQLAWGEGHEVVESGRAATSHTPGGTGALRVVGDFLHQNLPSTTLWLTTPTWANHPAIFAAAGVPTKTFPYFDPQANALDLPAMLAAIKKMPAGDAILLHGCCHNPTGIDPTADQWKQIADAVYAAGVLPVLDFAYQGFGDGLSEDAAGLREFTRPSAELVACSSYSKNFGLYRERVGAATFVAGDAGRCAVVQSQVKRAIRANYSNPPAFGAALVTTILGDPKLRKQWEGELAEMRGRINGMRKLLVDKLAEHRAPGDFGFIAHQRGMFSFSGLTEPQVAKLKSEHAIYMVGSGRMNVAGVTPANVDRLCAAVAQVLGA